MAAAHPKWSGNARLEAEKLGQRIYSGAPCNHVEAHREDDGTTKRYVSHAQCVKCVSGRMLSLRVRSRALRLTRRGETFVGSPCANGHDGTRYLSNHKCVFCPNPHKGSERPFSAVPDKPRNPQPGNSWPFGKCFEDHPNPVAGKYVKNLRHLPLRVGTWGVS